MSPDPRVSGRARCMLLCRNQVRPCAVYGGMYGLFFQEDFFMPAAPSFFHVFSHLFLLYISWGSSYVAIKWCLDALGPFLLAGSRMLLAGALLSLLLLVTGHWKRPTRADVLHAVWLAVFMVLIGCGFLAKGQLKVRHFFRAFIDQKNDHLHCSCSLYYRIRNTLQ